jgi:hypothetical protein
MFMRRIATLLAKFLGKIYQELAAIWTILASDPSNERRYRSAFRTIAFLFHGFHSSRLPVKHPDTLT